MNSKYNKFSWYISGFKSKEDAEASFNDVYDWFRKTHDLNEWKAVSSVAQGPYGWKWEFSAEKGEASDD